MRQQFVGVVVGTAMQLTAKVRVASQRVHPIVHKLVTKHKNILAHDAEQVCSVGDVVRIEACRPISKRKTFKVLEIIRRAKTWTDPDNEEVKR
ncbi:2165_t:CDS:2 [Paraglomus brasilianum]|uniref:2165_t:CDS:1 n=1 Tax=Paraglomus brasilianum TaxID=144538 RepID=A0A9N8ZKG5_9GLOM|nr:2165_t:CDS:2 [Paraglomus brasilianum]